jgi:hypothetical protein
MQWLNVRKESSVSFDLPAPIRYARLAPSGDIPAHWPKREASRMTISVSPERLGGGARA